MHTLNRLIAVCALMLLVVPAGTFVLVGQASRAETEAELQQAIESAALNYRQRGGAQSAKTKAEEAIAQTRSELMELQRRKRGLRVELGKQLKRIKAAEALIGSPLTNELAIESRMDLEAAQLSTLLHAAYRWDKQQDNVATLFSREPAGRALMDRELGRRMEESKQTVETLSGTLTLRSSFDSGMAELEAMRTRYREIQDIHDNAVALKARSDAQLGTIKQITADVHNQVIRLQASLARIDARLRSKIERSLIEKGLLDPEKAREKAASAAVRFQWPVIGAISAGYLNAEYVEHFGVPHKGMDIVVPQSTPVGAAADGVVFIVRDGGQYGYTYILIGHRDGYATLYGHLSATFVSSGQEVEAGQTIGLSGGKPGTQGAGPMTTGAHLHFETMQHGAHFNPTKVLP